MRALRLCAWLALAPCAALAAAPAADERRHAEYRSDGAVLSQARYCGYAYADLGRLAERSLAAARRAAERAGAAFDEAGYQTSFRDGARDNDGLLALVDPSSRERECAQVRRQVDAVLRDAPAPASAPQTDAPGPQR